MAAINVVGTSTASLEGNGAIILTNPDAPHTLANVPSVTLGDRIGLSWLEGGANGGTPVIDYQISQAEEAGTYAVIATGVTDLSYTATDLTAGTTYKFKV